MRFTFCLILFLITSLKPNGPVFFVSTPTLSPNGEFVVFSYGGDLWQVSSSGGIAKQLTFHERIESHPVYSPDGKYIAFSGYYDGSRNIHVMEADGSNRKQLTHNGSFVNYVASWSPDSKMVYYSTNSYNTTSTYSIYINAGTPAHLFRHYENLPHNVTPRKDGSYYFLNSSVSESHLRLWVTPKGYRGGDMANIMVHYPKSGKTKEITDTQGNELSFTMDGKGTLYFISDRNPNPAGFLGSLFKTEQKHFEFNLFTLRNGKSVALTNGNASIKSPSVSWNGEKVAFIKDYQLYIYNVKSKSIEKPQIEINSVNPFSKEREVKVTGEVQNFNVSPNDSSIAYIAKNKLFVFHKADSITNEINSATNVVYNEVSFYGNSKLVYTRISETGNYKAYLFDLISNTETQLTNGLTSEHFLTVSPSTSKLYCYSGKNALLEIDLNSYEQRILTEKNILYIYNSKPHLSNDGSKLLFTALEGVETDIYLYDLQQDTFKNISNSAVSEFNPLFFNNEIHFNSDRMNNDLINNTEASVYKFAELYGEPKEVSKMNEGYSTLRTCGKYLYALNEENLVDVVSKEIIQKKVKKYELNCSDSSAYFLIDNDIYIRNKNNKELTKLKLSHSFKINKLQEAKAKFYSVYSDYADAFYNNTVYFQNFKHFKDMYESYLPYVQTTTDLNGLINDLLGELRSSHTTTYVYPMEERDKNRHSLYNPGLFFEPDRPVVKTVVPGSVAETAGIKIGDEIKEINGAALSSTENMNRYFSSPKKMDSVSISLNRNGSSHLMKLKTERTWEIDAHFIDSYKEGLNSLVESSGKNKIAYIKLMNSYERNYDAFVAFMNTEFYRKKALIIDLRYSNGGNRYHKFISFLENARSPYIAFQMRESKKSLRPYLAREKPIVLLVNERTASDSEVFAYVFQQRKLGTVIGNRTKGSMIYSNRITTNNYLSWMPTVGVSGLDGFVIENHGVLPDIEQRTTFDDRENGRDPQLEYAVKHLLKKLDE